MNNHYDSKFRGKLDELSGKVLLNKEFILCNDSKNRANVQRINSHTKVKYIIKMKLDLLIEKRLESNYIAHNKTFYNLMEILKSQMQEIMETSESIYDSKEKIDFKEIEKDRDFYCEQALFYKNKFNKNQIKHNNSEVKLKTNELKLIKQKINLTEKSNIVLKRDVVNSIEKIESFENLINNNTSKMLNKDQEINLFPFQFNLRNQKKLEPMKESIYELEKELRDEKVKGEYYARQKENFISKTNLLEMALLNAVDEVTAEIIIRKKANEGKINNYPRKSHSIPDLKPGEYMTYKDFGHYDKRNVLMKFLSNKETLRFISSNKKIKNSILSNTLSMSHDRYNKKNNDRNYKTRHSLDAKKENLFYK